MSSSEAPLVTRPHCGSAVPCKLRLRRTRGVAGFQAGTMAVRAGFPSALVSRWLSISSKDNLLPRPPFDPAFGKLCFRSNLRFLRAFLGATGTWAAVNVSSHEKPHKTLTSWQPLCQTLFFFVQYPSFLFEGEDPGSSLSSGKACSTTATS